MLSIKTISPVSNVAIDLHTSMFSPLCFTVGFIFLNLDSLFFFRQPLFAKNIKFTFIAKNYVISPRDFFLKLSCII